MRTIGIVGGLTWQSTLTYYRTINERVQQKLGGEHSARILLYSLDFAEIDAAQQQDDWQAEAAILVEAANRLKVAGADFWLMACNTAHAVADQVVQEIDLPFLHIAEVAADAVMADGLRTVVLTGTHYTMQLPFYREVLERKGLRVILPSANEQEIIARIVDHELAHGIIRAESLQAFRSMLIPWQAQGAEAVILGCTEIGLLINRENLAFPVYDTALLHAAAAAELALADDATGRTE